MAIRSGTVEGAPSELLPSDGHQASGSSFEGGRGGWVLNVPTTAWGEGTSSTPLCCRRCDLACNSNQSEYFFDSLVYFSLLRVYLQFVLLYPG